MHAAPARTSRALVPSKGKESVERFYAHAALGSGHVVLVAAPRFDSTVFMRFPKLHLSNDWGPRPDLANEIGGRVGKQTAELWRITRGY